MNYVGEKPADVLTLDLYPYGNTSFNLYEDDGLTRDYKKGEFARTLISVSSPKGEKGTITVDIAKAKGDYKGRYQERTYLLDVRSESSPSNVTVAGKPLSAISPEADSDHSYTSVPDKKAGTSMPRTVWEGLRYGRTVCLRIRIRRS